MNTFQASVQYGDLKGSVAADVADLITLSGWLQDKGHIEQSECLLGVDVDVNIISEKVQGTLDVHFLVSNLDGFSNIPELLDNNDSLSVKRVALTMTFEEFFVLFKRFNLTISSKGLLEGKHYSY